MTAERSATLTAQGPAHSGALRLADEDKQVHYWLMVTEGTLHAKRFTAVLSPKLPAKAHLMDAQRGEGQP